MEILSAYLRRISSDLTYWADKLKDEYGLTVKLGQEILEASNILRQIYLILSTVPKDLVKDCGIKTLILRYLGENKEKFPNHGYYQASDQSITINSDIFVHPDQPDDFFDYKGYFIDRPTQTLLHEMGHAFEAVHGYLSLKPAWMSLSGWSKTYKPGLKRLLIKEPGTPDVLGEMFFDPTSLFTRFYGKRNPEDDFADCFSMFVGGLEDKVPPLKRKYFDTLLKKYY